MTLKLSIMIMIVLSIAVSVAQAGGDPARGETLKGECVDCHGEDGLGDEQYPRIAGLEESYLYEQLRAFKNGERPNRAEMMLWFLEDLNDQDLADLAAFYASQSAE